MNDIINIRLDGPAEAVAAARDRLEALLGEELIRLGQVVPSRREAGGALCYGIIRMPAPQPVEFEPPL